MARTPTKLIVDHYRHDLWREPHWRWLCAVAVTHSSSRRISVDDDAIAVACRFQLGLAAADTPSKRVALADHMPDLDAALGIFQEDGLVRAELEARLLARQSPQDIMAVMKLPTPVIDLYRDLFFDLPTGNRGNDWIAETVLRLHMWHDHDPTEAEIWRWVGWATGPYMLDLLIADHLQRPHPALPDRHEMAEGVRLMARLLAQALRTPLPEPGQLIELERLLEHRLLGDPASPETALLRLQLDFLRRRVGLQPRWGAATPPANSDDPSQPDKATVPVDGQREAVKPSSSDFKTSLEIIGLNLDLSGHTPSGAEAN